MEPESPTPEIAAMTAQETSADASALSSVSPGSGGNGGPTPEPHGLRWVFIGSQGLRAGWSVALFMILFVVFSIAVGTATSAIEKNVLHAKPAESLTPAAGILGEGLGVLGLLAAAWIMAKIERRRVMDYNLKGPGRTARFASGLLFGFLALSALVGGLAAGGWLHFGGMALSGGQIVLYAALWALTFTLVGCVEEGTMRCYLLYTFERGINFWWAAGIVSCVCGLLLWKAKGEGVWGAYFLALAGVLPCLALQLKKSTSVGFWNAAWVTSFLFGAGHTGNNGENWIGIFAAGAIGFVFCVSVRLTGSAWWAIGCHASWDWGETYFYGTADSGMVAKGHLLTSTPAGPAFWSGGTDGPEGSVLVLGVILLLLLAILAVYGRRRQAVLRVPAPAQVAG